MVLTLADLIYINDAAKALKQKQFLFFRNKLYGTDNIMSYLVYVDLDVNHLSKDFYSYSGVLFNARDLSKFVKSLSIEKEFEINTDVKMGFLTSMACESMPYIIDFRLDNIVLQKVDISNNRIYSNDEYIDDMIAPLFSMKKVEGTYSAVYNNKYYITLFPGLLPLNKGDKACIAISDDINSNMFVARFKVIKKKFVITLFIGYLKV